MQVTTHELSDTPVHRAPLVLVEIGTSPDQAEADTNTDKFEETNRELLAYLGEKTIEEWYAQNGLGYTVPASTYEVTTSLAEHWVTMGGIVTRGEVSIDGDTIYGDGYWD